MDGDKYFVCWDDELIPRAMSKPMDYSSNVQAREPPEITRTDLIDHFAHAQRLNQVGIVDSCFSFWANKLGVRSVQCRRLAELFSVAVDAPKTGEKVRIPAELRPPRTNELQSNVNENKFVWMKMIERAKEFRKRFQTDRIQQQDLTILTKESLLELFRERRSPTTAQKFPSQTLKENELIVATLKWCNEQENGDEILKQLMYFFDFSQVSSTIDRLFVSISNFSFLVIDQ